MPVKLLTASGGAVTLQGANTAVDTTVTVPATNNVTLLTDSSGVMNIGSGQIYKDASGNVGFGTTSPTGRTTINYSTNGAYDTGLAVTNSNSGSGAVTAFQLKNDVGNRAGAYLTSSTCPYYGGTNTFNLGTVESIPFTFLTGNSERARIDTNGNLLVGTTSNGGVGLTIQNQSANSGAPYLLLNKSFNGNTTGVYFQYNGTSVGSITYSNTATAYNTSSDYRLKHDIQPMQNALAKVAALKPVTYKWNADNSDGEGFIAHELAEVCPHAVNGEKDAVDSEGNPIYQGIDTSFLVATLTAAIQEQQVMIEELKAKVAALEAKA